MVCVCDSDADLDCRLELEGSRGAAEAAATTTAGQACHQHQCRGGGAAVRHLDATEHHGADATAGTAGGPEPGERLGPGRKPAQGANGARSGQQQHTQYQQEALEIMSRDELQMGQLDRKVEKGPCGGGGQNSTVGSPMRCVFANPFVHSITVRPSTPL